MALEKHAAQLHTGCTTTVGIDENSAGCQAEQTALTARTAKYETARLKIYTAACLLETEARLQYEARTQCASCLFGASASLQHGRTEGSHRGRDQTGSKLTPPEQSVRCIWVLFFYISLPRSCHLEFLYVWHTSCLLRAVVLPPTTESNSCSCRFLFCVISVKIVPSCITWIFQLVTLHKRGEGANSDRVAQTNKNRNSKGYRRLKLPRRL